MKKISAFRSKGGMKFLFGSILVIVTVIIFIKEFNSLSDLAFIGGISYSTMVILYYNYIG